jgi:hypothetical protein
MSSFHISGDIKINIPMDVWQVHPPFAPGQHSSSEFEQFLSMVQVFTVLPLALAGLRGQPPIITEIKVYCI